MSQGKKLILIILAIVLLAIPVISQADQKPCKPGLILPPCTCRGNCTFDDFVLLFIRLAAWGLSILGLIAVLYLIWSAWGLMTSAGNPEKIKAGQQGIVNTLLGLFFVLGAWLLVNSIFMSFTGGKEGPFDGKVFSKWYEIPSGDNSRDCPIGKECINPTALSKEDRDKRECVSIGKCSAKDKKKSCCLYTDPCKTVAAGTLCTDVKGLSGAQKESRDCKGTGFCPDDDICCLPCPKGKECTNIVGFSESQKTAKQCEVTGKCGGDVIKDKKGKTIDEKYTTYNICCLSASAE